MHDMDYVNRVTRMKSAIFFIELCAPKNAIIDNISSSTSALSSFSCFIDYISGPKLQEV